MDQFSLLGSLALRLHLEFRMLYFVLLPIFFSLALIIAWFRYPQGGPDFVETIKRAFVATLLLVGFFEITDMILLVADGLAARIDNMMGIETFMKMAADKTRSYTLSPTSVVLAFNDLLISVLAFLSYIVLYVARFVMVAIYHFSWVFLSIIAPIMLLFHLFSPKLTLNLFRSLIEVASWKVVWAVLSAMLTALPFGNAYMADGNYLTVIVLNFVISLCMLGTPLVVHSLVGNGLSGFASALIPAVAGTMIAAPARATMLTRMGREVLSDTHGFAAYHGSKLASRFSSVFQSPPVGGKPPVSPSSSQSNPVSLDRNLGPISFPPGSTK